MNEQPPVTDVKPPLPRLDQIDQFSEETLDNMAKIIQNIILKSEEFNKQRWSPRGRLWPRGHILKSLASKPQVLENCPVLGSRTALFLNR